MGGDERTAVLFSRPDKSGCDGPASAGKHMRWAAPILLLLVDDSQAPGNGTGTRYRCCRCYRCC